MYKRRRRSTLRMTNKISVLDDFSKISNENLIFEQEEFQKKINEREKFVCFSGTKKRGLRSLNIIAYYFEL